MNGPTCAPALEVLYAGSLDDLVREELFPRFEDLAGYRCAGRAGGSREWARQLRLGQVEADLLLSADSSVNELELMRPGGAVAEWYLTFATNELVLGYSRASPAFPEMEAMARTEDGWLRLLRSGLRLGRPDPELDPKGYRTLFALQLAESQFGLTGLAAEVAGGPRNPQQLFPADALMPMLERGELDLVFCYRSQAEETGIPYLPLPEHVNLGSPEMAEVYSGASYRCQDGTTYLGAPIAYTATPLVCARHPVASAALLVFLASSEGAECVRLHGFRPARALVRPGLARHD
ncbi:MAG: substrate-binding domain-containing protein [Armatimonadota bacterium]